MIHETSYHKDWLLSHRQKKGLEKINPPLAEKMIHALSLVEQLVIHGLDFVFKGGTSLVLLLEDAGRFSIDVDIITLTTRQQIEDTLAKICIGKPFIKWILNERRSYGEGVPKAHYSLVYQSAWSGNEDHILLDILFEDHGYPKVIERPVRAHWLRTEGSDTMVKMPSAESILGDKLTAFAPTTTGILFGNNKEVGIIKQLHDVGKLYTIARDMEIVAAAFEATVAQEIVYRGSKHKREDVLQDIVDSALLIAAREKTKHEPAKSYFGEIRRGLLQFKAYQTSSVFRIDEAIVSSAKAALLARRILTGNLDPLPVFNAIGKKEDHLIKAAEFTHLNKLSVESLFYWFHAFGTRS